MERYSNSSMYDKLSIGKCRGKKLQLSEHFRAKIEKISTTFNLIKIAQNARETDQLMDRKIQIYICKC